MNSIIQKLDELINGDFALMQESVDIECKLAIGKDGKGGIPRSLWETYSAFANTNGGIIILGAKELRNSTFEAHGVENLLQIKTDLFNTLNNTSKVSKNLITDQLVREWQVDDKNLLVIAVPRASRKKQPIYLNGNPLNNTYIRQNEGDYALDDEHVKRMLAEQAHDGRDEEILPSFGLDDLATESVRSYRQRYSNLNPNAELNDLTDIEFLRRIGAYGINRGTGLGGLTKAGLLMFGMQHTISEVFPNYMLDYQEHPHVNKEVRWIDRVVPDGSWSGNLYDFYKKVYNKLIQDLKIPFELKDGIRQDDTPVHIALREALVNCIVHADYTDRASVRIIKRHDMFVFRNPGLMRIPLEHALKGSESDCRNRKLHQMFRLINVGEQAGSGIPKILSGWQAQHWIPPYLYEKRQPNNQTLLELTMVDLFPADTMQQLIQQFGSSFTKLTQNERAALAIAKIEGTVTHARLQTVVSGHSVDISRDLQHLVKEGFLNSSGGRGAVYTLVGVDILTPEDVFSNAEIPSNDFINASSSVINDTSSVISDTSSVISDTSSVISDTSSVINGGLIDKNNHNRDSWGRLCSEKLVLPVIDDLSVLSESFKTQLYMIAIESRSKQRLDLELMENIILKLCEEQFFTLGALAEVLNRKPEALRRAHLTRMIKAQKICLAFPTKPTHEKQAYRSNTEISHTKN